MGTIILSALVAHTGWHWMIDRAAYLRQFPFQWPAINAALLAGAMRWLLATLIVAAVVWAAFGPLGRWARRGAPGKEKLSTQAD